ncbi:DUF4197 domain-containing protein [Chitinimonas sp. PSY-7]|uniref:DUF4197 family protein n=1 Tax=Chitinimonas sp. PSY-7 TaxID=3459088 RepID=UPI00403FDF14
MLRPISILCLSLLCSLSVLAIDLSQLTSKDASSGLKEALTTSASKAISQLGKTDGFFGNEQVKISLPDNLKPVEKMLRKFGMGDKADELVLTMNRAAESAVQEAKPILINSIKNMSVQDAKGIITGNESAATDYFRRTSGNAITEKFLPIIKKSTSKLKLAEKYNAYAGQAAKFGLVKTEDANLDDYVTRKAVDGLFNMIANEEKNIRTDPMGQASKLLQKVFGAK